MKLAAGFGHELRQPFSGRTALSPQARLRRSNAGLLPILAADIVGYSRLMGVDEVGTLTALKSHRREIVDPTIAAHKGQIVKTTGDGIWLSLGARCGCSDLRDLAVQGKNGCYERPKGPGRISSSGSE